MAKKAHKKEEVAVEATEESIVEEPKVDTRALPEDAGEETSETIMQGGQLMRVVKTKDRTKYIPL